MYKRLSTLVIVILLALLALVLTAGGALAQSTPIGVTVPYASRLTDDAGQPLNGEYAFTFALYDAVVDGQLLWSETRTEVVVKNGDFSIALGEVRPIPKDVAGRKELWLSVSVRGPQDLDFTLLNPRHNLSAPSAVSALTCPHTHFNDYWSGANQSYALEVENDGGGDTIRAYNYATRTDYAAVYAINFASTGNGTAVFAASNKGLGVYASSGAGDGLEATSNTTWASAVYAHATNGNGVWAVSGNKIGVYATTANTTTNVSALEAYNSGTPTGGYGGKITSKNYRGGFIGTENYGWYGAAIDGGLIMSNGGCTGCTLVYVGQNNGDEAVHPGDLVAAGGVKVDAATSQPVMLVRLASNASDPVIGVVVGGASAPGSQTGPDKPEISKIMRGEYMQIAVSGLVQARVGSKTIAIGAHLLPGAAGAMAAADASNSVARVMSEPDKNGLVWVMVNGR